VEHAKKDNSTIIGLIRSILPSVTDPDGVDIYERDSADFQLPRLYSVSVGQEALLQLTAELRKFHEIADLEGGVVNHSPFSSSRPLKAENFAHWLLAQSRFRAPEECLEELLATVRRNTSPLLEIVPVWGISPRLSFDLGEGLSVVPIAELPPSHLKDLMMGKRRHAFSFEIANSFPKPGAALVRGTMHGPLFEGPKSKAALHSDRQSQLMLAVVMGPTEEAKRRALDEFAKTTTLRPGGSDTSIAPLAQELCEVVALLTSKPIFTLAQWYQSPENTPLLGRIAAYSGPTNDHPFFIEIKAQDYPVDDIVTLVRQYRALNQSIRDRLRTPLSRLNQGRRHLEHDTIEDGAIDLGIAAEALLTQDRDADAPISFTLRARGTLLLDGTADQRKQNYRALKDLYTLRSKAAHEGSIVARATLPMSGSASRQLQEATEKVKSGQRVCTELIVDIIRRGQFPDWDQLMFGW
jgi:hypothetical protein